MDNKANGVNININVGGKTKNGPTVAGKICALRCSKILFANLWGYFGILPYLLTLTVRASHFPVNLTKLLHRSLVLYLLKLLKKSVMEISF